jgi:hypothetical protein
MHTAKEKTKMRSVCVDYTTRSEANRMLRDYSQARPGRGYMVPPEQKQRDDCSMYVSKTYNWIMHKTGIYLRDPIDNNYTGIGNTGSMDWLYAFPVDTRYILVGDIALWGPNKYNTEHTAVCRKRGSISTALFSSHGHQSWRFGDDAPNAYTIVDDRAQHLIGVFRHPAFA